MKSQRMVKKDMRSIIKLSFSIYFFFVCFILLPSFLFAGITPKISFMDIISLKDGRKIEGVLEKKGEQYWIRLRWGKISVHPKDILRIQKKPLSWLEKNQEKKATKNIKEKKKKSGTVLQIQKKVLEIYKKKGGKIAKAFCLSFWAQKKKEYQNNKYAELESHLKEFYQLLFQKQILEMEIPFFLQQATFSEVLRYLKDTSGFTFKISPFLFRKIQKKGIRLSYRHPGRKLYLALNDISQAFHLDWSLDYPPLCFRFFMSPKKGRQRKLSLQDIRFSLQLDTTLDKFLAFLKKKTGFSFVLESQINSSKVKVQGFFEEEKLSKILNKVLRPR
ncbi:MAG: hypothetical protein D6785_01015, partial [Planctomycetota bacterium]